MVKILAQVFTCVSSHPDKISPGSLLKFKHNLSVKFAYVKMEQDAPNGISTGCLMWPHLFPLYASQIFKTILPSQLK